MAEKIKEIAEDTWEFIKSILALIFIVLIFTTIAFGVVFAVLLSVWCFDKLMLGGVIFG